MEQHLSGTVSTDGRVLDMTRGDRVVEGGGELWHVWGTGVLCVCWVNVQWACVVAIWHMFKGLV